MLYSQHKRSMMPDTPPWWRSPGEKFVIQCGSEWCLLWSASDVTLIIIRGWWWSPDREHMGSRWHTGVRGTRRVQARSRGQRDMDITKRAAETREHEPAVMHFSYTFFLLCSCSETDVTSGLFVAALNSKDNVTGTETAMRDERAWVKDEQF